MTLRLRPSLSSSTLKPRPLSAIFVGGASSNNLPELPEPPSPGGSSSSARSSSRHSGLPSPPATNSTGSGSTGDNSTNAGSLRLRDRAVSLPSQPLFTDTHNTADTNMNNTFNASHDSSTSQTPSRNLDGDDDGKDEDETARQPADRGYAILRSPSENVLALQRVQSLAQKNRVALDKLSSYSRLSSPSPAPSSASRPSVSRARSPFPQSSSRPNAPHAASPRKTPDTLSGSETEREQNSCNEHEDIVTPPTSAISVRDDSRLSQAHLSSTQHSPPRTFSGRPDLTNSPSRQRRTSAPAFASPDRAYLPVSRENSGVDGQNATGVATRTARPPRNNLNLAVVDHLYERDRPRDRGGERDVTTAALAAVASARESLSSGRKSRAALPREFRETGAVGERKSLEYRAPSTPSTPNHQRLQLDALDQNVYIARGSPSPKSSGSLMLGGNTNGFGEQWGGPRRTLRKRSGTIRGVSEDLGPDVPAMTLEDRTTERRSVMRGADSPNAARSLVGQGFKAAGIMRRKDSTDNGGEDASEDVFGGEGADSRRRRSRLGSVVGAVASVASALGTKGKGKARDVQEWVESEVEAEERRRESGRMTGSVSGGSAMSSVRRSGTYSHSNNMPDADSPSDHRERERDRSAARYVAHHRPTASMVNYQSSSVYGEDDEDNHPLRSAPPGSRGFKSPYTSTHLEREKDRMAAGSRQGDRYSSPLLNNSGATKRHSASTSLYRQPSPSPPLHGHVAHSEHGRLMMESLRTFESQLLRLPNTTAVPELFKGAQNIAHTAEKLNMLLRGGTNRALEAQIDAEVGEGDGEIGAEVWRRVGGEYRESLRVSDELVRTVTSFMLSMGKVLKETSTDEFARHRRDSSLEPEAPRTGPLDAGSLRRSLEERRNMEGRRSVASHRSSEHGSDSVRRLTPRQETVHASSGRPTSSLAFIRDRDRYNSVSQSTSSRNFSDPLAFRHLSKQESSDNQDLKVSLAESADSTETVHGADYSPSPAARFSHERSRTLPHLSMPPPPPPQTQQSLSPESASSSNTSSATEKSLRRRSNIVSSNSRGVAPTFNAIATPNATTAVTPHTVSSPERATIPLSRTNSSISNSRAKTVTFSRSSNVSISALTGLQQEDNRKRTISNSSSNTGDVTAKFSPAIKKSASGSDAERDPRRRTMMNGVRASLDTERPAQVDEIQSATPARRERRRTITEIFS